MKIIKFILGILRIIIVFPILIIVIILGMVFPKLYAALLRFFDLIFAPYNIKTLLKGKTAKARAGAAYSLGAANHQRAVLPLIEALKDEDESVRIQAAFSLSILADKRAIPALELMRDNDKGTSMGYDAQYVATQAIEAINEGIRKPVTVHGVAKSVEGE